MKHRQTRPRVRDAMAIVAMTGSAALGAACAPARTWTGVIGDSYCGAAGHLWDEHGPPESPRDCAVRCIREGAQYVLVSDDGTVYPIANQDAQGLGAQTGIAVTISGSMREGMITVRAIEPMAVPAPQTSPAGREGAPEEGD